MPVAKRMPSLTLQPRHAKQIKPRCQPARSFPNRTLNRPENPLLRQKLSQHPKLAQSRKSGQHPKRSQSLSAKASQKAALPNPLPKFFLPPLRPRTHGLLQRQSRHLLRLHPCRLPSPASRSSLTSHASIQFLARRSVFPWWERTPTRFWAINHHIVRASSISVSAELPWTFPGPKVFRIRCWPCSTCPYLLPF